jgi:hypothetical protein
LKQITVFTTPVIHSQKIPDIPPSANPERKDVEKYAASGLKDSDATIS